jgi:hypothetical protein
VGKAKYGRWTSASGPRSPSPGRELTALLVIRPPDGATLSGSEQPGNMRSNHPMLGLFWYQLAGGDVAVTELGRTLPRVDELPMEAVGVLLTTAPRCIGSR